MTKYTTYSLKQTLSLGQKTAKSFNTNIIGLIGELGSGKTAFTKGVGEYFGIKNITSPTFVVMKVYEVKKNNSKIKRLVHVDCYRLNNYQSLLEIGLEEYLNDPESLVLIEWADKIKDKLPKNTKYFKFKLGETEDERVIEIK